jgi:pto-interacting protein 1
MITRKKAADGNTYLIHNFIEAFKSGKKVRQMFDKDIVDGKESIKVLHDIAKLADQCSKLENRLRPEMVEVADRLRKCMKDLQLRRREEMPESSGNCDQLIAISYVVLPLVDISIFDDLAIQLHIFLH